MMSYVVPTPRRRPRSGPPAARSSAGRHHVRRIGNGAARRPRSTAATRSSRCTPDCAGPGSSRRPLAPGQRRRPRPRLDAPALLPGGMMLEDGKGGTAYLLKAGSLGRRRRSDGQAAVCAAYGQAAVHGGSVYEPCDPGGLAAVEHRGEPDPGAVARAAGACGSPVVGGGAVWVADWKAGTLYELDQATGATRDSLGLGHHAAALLVDVDDGQPRVPRHDGGRDRGRRRLTTGDEDEARDGGAHRRRPGRGGGLQRFGRGRGIDGLGASVQDADAGSGQGK